MSCLLVVWAGCAREPQRAPRHSPSPPPLAPARAPAVAESPPGAASAIDAGEPEPLPEHDAWLEYMDERSERVERFGLATDAVVRVGRRGSGVEPPDVDLGSIEDGDTVSRRHAEIMQREGSWMIFVQPDTTNRSFLNGVLIDRGTLTPLAHGDTLQLGAVTLIFRTREGANAERARR